ncbi:MAG: TauD/TfdA family dioxygenase [Polyangiaceae bacterium]
MSAEASRDEGDVELHDGWIRVHFGGARSYADFHHRWLRHNCDVDRHPKTRERTVDSSELPDDLPVERATVRGAELQIEWAYDHRVSRYSLDWLWLHAYAKGREEPPPPLSDVAKITVDGRGLDVAARVRAARAVLDAHGVAVVRRDPANNVPPEDETEAIVDAFAEGGLRVIGTHFGRIEDLRTDNTTNQNTDQLGYTDSPVDLHTDQPFIPSPPRYQLLQGVRPAEVGGENYVVDAFAAARVLGAHDRRARELLSTVNVRFHRKQKAFESLVVAPILGEAPSGPIVRYSYFTMDPHQVPFAEMEEWYRAYDRFARLVRDPKNQVRFTLGAGDFLVYDNHRMLHARTAFRGARWLRGIYFDR